MSYHARTPHTRLLTAWQTGLKPLMHDSPMHRRSIGRFALENPCARGAWRKPLALRPANAPSTDRYASPIAVCQRERNAPRYGHLGRFDVALRIGMIHGRFRRGHQKGEGEGLVDPCTQADKLTRCSANVRHTPLSHLCVLCEHQGTSGLWTVYSWAEDPVAIRRRIRSGSGYRE
ncbi:hypothetical protein PYCCODRAFT_1104589 [Trametes coccinea BRFM310]|uniref:Uncharacterized protein n=1 Tax=Trametes coccinea (strain BRFM310) TaxID=1353009 RepID=A0A1Y2I9G7_TRAC3|nr:hypothetical protein PYCCODRAFT_1104589 [Trametes coccinea BRFM310]